MATTGKYCKAYPIQQLRQFNNWTEDQENTRKETQEINGTEVKHNRVLTDDDFLYLQEKMNLIRGFKYKL